MSVCLFVCLTFPEQLFGQSEGTLFTYIEDTSILSSDENARLAEFKSWEATKSIHVISVSEIETNQSNGQLSFQPPNSTCTYIFSPQYVEPVNDYLSYYGVYHPNSGECLCQGGSIQIVQSDQLTSASISIESELYEIRRLSDQYHVLIEVDTDNNFICGAGEPVIKMTGLKQTIANSRVGTCPIKVLFLYTESVAESLTVTEIEADAVEQLQTANHALTNSDVSSTLMRFQFAGVALLPDFEVENSPIIDLEDFSAHPTVLDLRDEYAADVVVGVVNRSKSDNWTTWTGLIRKTIGIASIFNTDPIPNGFTLVGHKRGMKGYMIAHELGHILGCRHADDPEDLPHRAHSFDIDGCLFKKEKRTIVYQGIKQGKIITYYSNPSVYYNGVATGTSSRDNVHSITTRACAISSIYSNDVDPSEPFGADISVVGDFCPNKFVTATAEILNIKPNTTYTYLWEKSTNPFQYVTVGTGSQYTFLTHPEVAGVVFLRLTITDNDGLSFQAYRSVVSSSYPGCPDNFLPPPGKEGATAQLNVFPNPASGDLVFEYNHPSCYACESVLTIMSSSGLVVHRRVILTNERILLPRSTVDIESGVVILRAGDTSQRVLLLPPK